MIKNELPKGWKEVELKEICEVKKGTSITKNKVTDGNIPVIAGGQQPAYYHNQDNRTGKTITISGSGAYAGFVAYFEIPIFASDCSTIQSRNKEIFLRYIYYFLKGNQQRIYNLQRGIAQPHVYPKDLAIIKIPLPPHPTQKKIVSIIEKAEKAKELRKEADNLTKEFLKSFFLELFGDPIQNTKNMPQEKGKDLFKFSSGKFNPTSNLKFSYEYPTYGGNGITGNSKDYLLEYPTLVIGRVGAYCGSIHKTPSKSWITDNAIYIKEFKKEFNLDFLYYLLAFLKMNRFALTVGQPKITQKPIEELEYLNPPIELQNKFASIVQQVEDMKEQQKHSKEHLDNLFNVLMQKAFKGELKI